MDADSSDQRSLTKDLRLLASFVAPFKGQMIKSLLIIGLINALGTFMFLVVGKGINSFADKDATDESAARIVLTFAGLFALIGLARAVLIKVREPIVMRLAMDLLRSLRTRLYGKVQMLSFNYLDRLTTGQIIQRATGDLNQIRDFLTNTCFQAFDAIVMGAVSIGVMMWINWRLALVVLLPFPLICFLYWRSARKLRTLQRRMRDEVDVMTSQLSETIQGVKVIRSFGQHDAEMVKYKGTVDELLLRLRPIFWIRAWPLNAVYCIARVWVGAVLVVGGYMVIQAKSLPVGDPAKFEVGYIMTFMMYMMMLVWRAQALMDVGDTAQDARAALERVMALMDAPPDVAESPDAHNLPVGGGEILFHNVSFAYAGTPNPDADVVERMKLTPDRKGPDAVRNINLTIRPGETVALVGPTGAGKSTIVSLLPRFYDPVEGRVFIDGQDVRNTRLEDLRRSIGIVFQETFLFRGSIAENIAYGRPEASREEIMRAARLAAASEFIENMPRGYDSEIGERGVSLSGGQRQRIAIARAILKRPRILILDDAMASVDAKTEGEIRSRLVSLMKGRTTLVIAHRLATVRTADRVVVMREGRVDDVGTHEELAARNEFYRTLCRSQLQGDRMPDGLEGESN